MLNFLILFFILEDGLVLLLWIIIIISNRKSFYLKIKVIKTIKPILQLMNI